MAQTGVLLDNHWLESALVTISRKAAATDVEFAASSDEITFSGGERDMDFKTLINGGNMRRFTPMTNFEISLKVYAAEIDVVHQNFFGDVTDVIQPLSVTNVLNRYEFRVIMMWCDGSHSSGAEITLTTEKAIRFTATAGLMTKCEPFWTDGELGFDITFKFAPYTTAAVGNITWESTDGEADKVLPVIANYS